MLHAHAVVDERGVALPGGTVGFDHQGLRRQEITARVVPVHKRQFGALLAVKLILQQALDVDCGLAADGFVAVVKLEAVAFQHQMRLALVDQPGFNLGNDLIVQAEVGFQIDRLGDFDFFDRRQQAAKIQLPNHRRMPDQMQQIGTAADVCQALVTQVGQNLAHFMGDIHEILRQHPGITAKFLVRGRQSGRATNVAVFCHHAAQHHQGAGAELERIAA